MTLIAYWLGQSVVAAATPEEAVAVMERHESPGRWQPDQARALTADELALPLDDGTVADALERCQAMFANASRLARVTQGGAQLLHWDYPQQ
ncbi:hypothetical protein D3C81_1975970 [compost metagenome]